MRTTRSSVRREAIDDIEDFAIVPRPPPPPPPPSPAAARQNPVPAAETATEESTETKESWTLLLSAGLRIAITPEMTATTLGRCIAQATMGEPLEEEDFQVAVSGK